jgi:hypothetical protein
MARGGQYHCRSTTGHEPATAAQLVAAIGSDTDARTVMSMFLKETFPPGDRRKTEFVLGNQIRDEWLPKPQGSRLCGCRKPMPPHD